jgi:uncharacterized protein DUF481
MRRRPYVLFPALLVALAGGGAARGQAEGGTEPVDAWTNSTDLSLVLTEGNSSALTFGLKNTLEYRTPRSLSRLRIDALRSDTSDDPYRQVEPGLTFLPGETLTDYSTEGVRPDAEPDVARYFAEGRYERDLSKNNTWNVGASWDRDDDAGILNRYIVFGGVGNTWVDREDRSFRTSYGASITDREEEILDPEKEQRFPGLRLTSSFKDLWGASTTYDNQLTFNVNLEDRFDYNVELVQGLAVSMTRVLSLKVSLQFLYASEPALEEVDVLARVLVVDPDGIAGNGDEYFETVASGGNEFTIGVDSLRKESLDTTFRMSLQITF